MAYVFTASSFPSNSRLHIPQHTGEREQIVSCEVILCQGKQLRITTDDSVTLGAAISVEHEDTLLLGEVAACIQHNGRWQIDVRIEHALNGLMDLLTLRSRLLMEEIQTKIPQTAQRN